MNAELVELRATVAKQKQVLSLLLSRPSMLHNNEAMESLRDFIPGIVPEENTELFTNGMGQTYNVRTGETDKLPEFYDINQVQRAVNYWSMCDINQETITKYLTPSI